MEEAISRILKNKSISKNKFYQSAQQLKIDLINEQPQLIPEHVDVTGEIDKLLKVIAGNKDKLAVLRQDYGTN